MQTKLSEVCYMFIPQRVIFETGSLDYNIGQKLYSHFKSKAIEINECSLNKVKTCIPGDTTASQYLNGKVTLVVGVKKELEFSEL